MKVNVLSPIQNERAVQGESVSFRAILSGKPGVTSNSLTWSSSLDGTLGRGTDITVNSLSNGTHIIKVHGKGVRASTQLRVFPDLGQFYEAVIAPAEVVRIDNDLRLQTVDGTGLNETWNVYPPLFDQQSTDPSTMVVYARFDLFRHQAFSQPLPIASGAIYELFKTFVKTLRLRLDCNFNSGGSGQISLNRSASVLDARLSATPSDPDACKRPFAAPQLFPYVNPLYLMIHEERHNEPGDPGHITVGGVPMDATLEGGSGYAQAALYTMWVYKYGKYDPPAIKAEAKQIATDLLRTRFPSS